MHVSPLSESGTLEGPHHLSTVAKSAADRAGEMADWIRVHTSIGSELNSQNPRCPLLASEVRTHRTNPHTDTQDMHELKQQQWNFLKNNMTYGKAAGIHP